MNVHFYRCDFEGPVPAAPSLSPPASFRCWRPRTDGPPPKGSRSPANYFWWILESISGFASPGFAELRIEERGSVIHRLIVTPGWYRFPFMSANDLQIGNIWTSPAARRRRLARTAIAEAHRRFAFRGARFWYLADANNAISAALARSCGYRLVAVGRRTRRFGVSLFGRFVVERFVHRAETDTTAIAPDCCDESAAGRSLKVNH
jgi:RimJ/RimL family protein N-acetyltransferase